MPGIPRHGAARSNPRSFSGPSAGRTSFSTAVRTAAWLRSKMPAGTGFCRCRWGALSATKWSAAITASSSTPPDDARTCPRRRPSTRPHASAPIRSSSGIGWCGSGRATRLWRTPPTCPISTGTTEPNGEAKAARSTASNATGASSSTILWISPTRPMSIPEASAMTPYSTHPSRSLIPTAQRR